MNDRDTVMQQAHQTPCRGLFRSNWRKFATRAVYTMTGIVVAVLVFVLAIVPGIRIALWRSKFLIKSIRMPDPDSDPDSKKDFHRNVCASCNLPANG